MHMDNTGQFYQSTISFVAGYITVDERVRTSTGKLSRISKQFHVDRGLILTAIRRNEYTLFCDLGYYLFSRGYFYFETLVIFYPKIPCPLKVISPLLVKMIHNGLDEIPKGDTIFKKIIQHCLRFTDNETFVFMVRLFSEIGSESPGFAADAIPIMEKIQAKLSWQDFASWAGRGVDLLTSGRRQEAVDFFRGDSIESRRFLNDPSITIRDMNKVLTIYSASLLKKNMFIRPLESSPYHVNTSHTDGKTMYLPSRINLFRHSDRNRQVYTVTAAQLAASLEYGTFGFTFSGSDLKKKLNSRYGLQLPGIMDNIRLQYRPMGAKVRELATGEIEAAFPENKKLVLMETEHEKFYYSFPVPHLARFIFSLIENSRLEHLLCARYTGLIEDFMLLNTVARHRRKIKPNERTGLELCMQNMIRYSMARNVPADSTADETSMAVVHEYAGIFKNDATVQDSARITFSIYNILNASFQLVLYASANDISLLFEGLHRPLFFPEMVLASSPEIMNRTARERGKTNENDQDLRLLDFASFRSQDKKYSALKKRLLSGPVKVCRYPEYNLTTGEYRQGHCTVFETINESVNTGYCRNVLNRNREIYDSLKKKFLLMTPEDVTMLRRWSYGDDIYLDDAINYFVDLKRGAVPDDRVYYNKQKNNRDIAAAILVDISSSAEETVGGRRIIDIEKESLVILAEALNRTGDTFGIYTFCSLGRENVFIAVIKEFHEKWNNTARGRVECIEPYASNRDGCAIRHIKSKLAEQPHATKLLIMLSDGIPADSNYGTESACDASAYGIEDTRRAVTECRAQGIKPYCITIDTGARSYIPHIYGETGYSIVSNVTTLPARLSKFYLRLTGD